MIQTPVSLIFQPIKLEIHYEKCLKLQIVIFRFSGDDKGGKRAVKMDKTEPMKFTNPELPILFTKTLNLLTTISYNSERKEYENKQVDFEMALQIDGKMQRMARKLNLKDIITSKEIKHKFEIDNPLLILHYKVQTILQEDQHSRVLQEKHATETKSSNKIIIDQEWSKSAKKIKKEENIPKSTKLLKIEEQSSITQQNLNGRKQENWNRPEKGNIKTVNFGITNQDTVSQVCTEKQIAMRKSKSATRIQAHSSKGLHKNRTSIQEFDQSQKMESIYKLRNEDFEHKYNDLLILHKQLSKKYSQRDTKVKEQDTVIRELQAKIVSVEKWARSAKEVVKQEQNLRNNCEIIITKLKEEIDQYKNQVTKLEKNNSHQEVSKPIFAGPEQQLKSARQKLRTLQLKYSEQAREVQELEKQIRNKDAQISELKSKTYALDHHNLELQSQLKNLQNKLAKERIEHDGDLRELTDQITQMKQQNRTLKKIPSVKVIKDDTVDLKKKLEMIEKQLQLKEQLLKKLSQTKKESDNENNALRKEIETLKDTAGRIQKKEETCIPIQQKIQLQKMKKELQGCRKNEKTLLIEKNRLETANHSHQEDIVRIKLSIANILNAVQETGNERLISEVYGFTE